MIGTREKEGAPASPSHSAGPLSPAETFMFRQDACEARRKGDLRG